MTHWTDAQKATIKEFWQAGYTAAQIVAALGPPWITRNAIIGVMHRAGMSREAGAQSKPREIKRTANPLGARVLKQLSLPPSPVVANKTKLPEPVSLNIALADLESRHCRWPSEEAPFTFCGTRHKDGSVYCEHHDKRAYNGVEPTRRQKQRSAA